MIKIVALNRSDGTFFARGLVWCSTVLTVCVELGSALASASQKTCLVVNKDLLSSACAWINFQCCVIHKEHYINAPQYTKPFPLIL